MKLTKLLLALFLVLPNLLQASNLDEPEGNYYKVRGDVYVHTEANDINHFRAKLYLSPGGVGSAFIHLHDFSENKKKIFEALNYFVEREYGRSVFYIIFPYKTKSEIVIMRGSYMRDDEVALYSGDIFVGPAEMLETLTSENPSFDEHENMRHLGIFSFKDRIINDLISSVE